MRYDWYKVLDIKGHQIGYVCCAFNKAIEKARHIYGKRANDVEYISDEDFRKVRAIWKHTKY